MKHTVSITKNSLFKRAYSRGFNNANSFLAIYVIKNNVGVIRLGITVSKKVGNAVVRNRVKRLIKENYRLIEDKIKNGVDIVIVSRIRGANAGFSDIQNSLTHLLKKTGVFKSES